MAPGRVLSKWLLGLGDVGVVAVVLVRYNYQMNDTHVHVKRRNLTRYLLTKAIIAWSIDSVLAVSKSLA